MELVWILLAVLVVLIFYVISIFNSLNTLKTRIHASIQQIGNHLKRQASLIPNLQESVKGYLKHEKGIFDQLTSARKAVDSAVAKGDVAGSDKVATQMQSLLPKLQVLVESNPELKADTTVRQFMDELRDTSDKLLFSRQTLIDLTQSYNQKLVVFPSNIIAGFMGFKPEKGLVVATEGSHLEVSAKESEDVKIQL